MGGSVGNFVDRATGGITGALTGGFLNTSIGPTLGGISGASSGGGSGKNQQPPAAPDYGQAAQQTQASQMSSQYTPYGSQIYSRDASSPSGYRSDITLAPQAQQTLDTQMGLSQKLGGMASGQVPYLQDRYSQPMQLGSVQDVANKAYGALTSRLDPQWNARATQEETKLVNQGLRPGDEAYTNAMRDFNSARNDAYQQANLGAISTMPQTYQLAASEYQQPLNVFNALRTGAQIQNPQFTPQPGANYLGAAQAQGQYAGDVYNAQVGQQNAMTQGLFGLGAAGLQALPFLMSDRRMKSNIVRVGTHRLGIGIYEYDLHGSRHCGVMADEVEQVRPEAVREIGGIKHVNYGMLDG